MNIVLPLSVETAPKGGSELQLFEDRRYFAGPSFTVPDRRSKVATSSGERHFASFVAVDKGRRLPVREPA